MRRWPSFVYVRDAVGSLRVGIYICEENGIVFKYLFGNLCVFCRVAQKHNCVCVCVLERDKTDG